MANKLTIETVDSAVEKLTPEQLRQFALNVFLSLYGTYSGEGRRGWEINPDREWDSGTLSVGVVGDLEEIGLTPEQLTANEPPAPQR